MAHMSLSEKGHYQWVQSSHRSLGGTPLGGHLQASAGVNCSCMFQRMINCA